MGKMQQLFQEPLLPSNIRSSGDRKDDDQISHIAAVIRDIFGELDDEEQVDYTVQNQIEDKEKNALVDEERNFQKELLDGVPYKPEEQYAEAEQKENDGLSTVLEIPVHHPLADPYKMYMIKLSNIVGIDPKPFDPSTYVAQDFYTTDKSGARRRILPNNIVRWRNVKNPDGTTTVESNSRFVIWDDGSMQLLIGEESFDVSEQDIHDMQTHLFSVHDKEILQCEGRIRKKMHFMPSSLTSAPHRTLSALVDARDKKAIKVRSCIAEIDPEWEIKHKKKAEMKINKANKQRGRKKGKVIHKHKQPVNRENHHLLPNILEDANDKLRLSASQCQFEGNLENKAGTGIHHFSAKEASHSVRPSPPLQGGTFQVPKHFPRFVFSAASSSQQPIDLFGSKEKKSSYNCEGKEYDGSSSDRSREKKHNCEEEANENSGDKSVVNDNFSKTMFFSSL
ncbi:LEO1 homolog isoform X2 [Olea europaea subsp. europaea]|uniref:LEO1 homolog isoform X2 n=2 Tax=Olea europaea subsp. europaea TaxID=158383 RepID=A0A8S0T7W7_OLEEU|nr:LEO1 homolog isoform X2 [Olea europaea subsp. europaea]